MVSPDSTPERDRLGNRPFSILRDNYGNIVQDRGAPELTKEQRVEIGARNFALAIYNETGDNSYMRALGLLPEDAS